MLNKNTTTATSFISIAEEEEGTFHLSYFGSQMALGFKGTPKFIERGYNWSLNTGVTNGQIHYLYNRFSYVIVKNFKSKQKGEEKKILKTCKEVILEALQSQFSAEIKLSGEIMPIKSGFDKDDNFELEHNEKAVQKLAFEKSKDFFNNEIVHENFMAKRDKSVADSYEFASAYFMNEKLNN